MFDVIIIGCGTIGSAIGCALASRGLQTGFYDTDPARRAALAGGVDIFHDAELAGAMRQAMREGRLHVLEKLERLDAPTNYIVCVPTPVSDSGALDHTALDTAMISIAAVAQAGDAIFMRSTLPIGMTRQLAQQDWARDLKFACTPDRSIEGKSFSDQFSIPALIGGMDEEAAARASALYGRIGETIDLGSPEAAEAAKLFANTWRATLFAASNAMAITCEEHGLDLHAILDATGKNYPRFAPPRPGPVGGPCLPKDLRLLASGLSPDASPLLRGVIASEDLLVARFCQDLDTHLAERKAPLRIAFAGLAFKGNPPVDDIRGSVALIIAAHLSRRWPDASFIAWDAAMTEKSIARAGFTAASDIEEAARQADLLLVGNNHPALKEADLERIAQTAKQGALIYDIGGITLPHRPSLPNNVRHRIIGRAEGA